MKILLILMLYVISGQVLCADVTGYAGGSVLINCRYDHPRYMNHTKYFCKLNGRHECTEKVLSNGQNGTSHEGRIFFMDIKNPGLFSVLIKNISQGDDGTYRCGVEDKGAMTTDVTLEVTEDPCCGTSQVQTVPPGEAVSFTCVYPEKFKNHFKYMYKATDRSYDAVIFTLGQSDQKGRFSLFDHPQENFFNVSISNVTEEDGGVYLCGAQQRGSGNSYISLFNEMQLQATAHKTSGSTLIIAMYVCVALLLIGGLVLIVYKLRYNKTQGSSSTSNRRNTENNDEVQHVPYYEEIPDSQPNTTMVYATTQKPRPPDTAASRTAAPPTVLPDRDFYTMAQLSNSETVSSADYATVDLH